MHSDPELEFGILADLTQDHDFGWVFFYNSKAYVESGDTRDQVPGCGPVIVLRETGATEFLPTFRPPALLIDEFARKWREQQSR